MQRCFSAYLEVGLVQGNCVKVMCCLPCKENRSRSCVEAVRKLCQGHCCILYLENWSKSCVVVRVKKLCQGHVLKLCQSHLLLYV